MSLAKIAEMTQAVRRTRPISNRMKLFAVAVLTYIAYSFALPIVFEYMYPYIPQNIPFFPVSVVLTTLLTGLAAFLYARWARVGLDVSQCILIGIVFIVVPGIMYLISWGVTFFENPLIAVDDLQSTMVPLFEQVEQGDFSMFLADGFSKIIYAAPFFIGPALASFFVKTQAVEEARIIL